MTYTAHNNMERIGEEEKKGAYYIKYVLLFSSF